LLSTKLDNLRDALALVLHRHLPVVQSFFFLFNLVVVALDAFGIMSAEALNFCLDLRVFLSFAGFELFDLFALGPPRRR